MDEYGQPLVGVAVQVKGTSLGVVTDLDGNFSFSIPVDSRALLFSLFGNEKLKRYLPIRVTIK